MLIFSSVKTSNILCAAITGSKETKRKLYSDADQIVLNLHNMVVLNGINIVPRKSDLVECSLLFELLPISKEERKTDAAFWSAFKADRPLILGAIFKVLSDAIKLLPTMNITSLHRMADANMEMLAIAAALGIDLNDFQNLLANNTKKLQEAYTQNNPFVDCVVSYVMLNGTVYKSTAEAYKEILRSIPGNRGFFPESSSAFGKRLSEEKDALEQMGIRLTRSKRADANYVRLEKIPQSQLTKAQKATILTYLKLSQSNSIFSHPCTYNMISTVTIIFAAADRLSINIDQPSTGLAFSIYPIIQPFGYMCRIER